MSSIQYIRNNYDQLRLSSTSNYTNKQSTATSSSTSVKGLVSDQISISSEGMDALNASRGHHARVNPLDELVNNGTITEDQKSKIEEALKAARDSETQSTDGSSPLSSLIEDGTITEDQDEAIKAQFDKMGPPPGKPPGGKPPMGPPPNGVSGVEGTSSSSSTASLTEDSLKKILESLTEDGTITDDQKTKISEVFNELIKKLYGDDSDSTDSTTGASTSVSGVL